MQATIRQRELELNQRARLFVQLAQTERAGLPAAEAAALLSASADPRFRQRLERFQRLLRRGIDVAGAGQQCGLFLPWETRLLRAAEVSGRLAQSYAGLGRRYTDRVRRLRRLKGRMTLPLAILVLAVFLAPLPSLILGEIGPGRYLGVTVGRLLLFFSGLYLLSWSWRRLGARGLDHVYHKLLLQIPFIGGLIRMQQQRDGLHSLALLLEAGVPVIEALDLAADSVSHPGFRMRFSRAIPRLQAGDSVTDALLLCGLLPDNDSAQLLRSGEFSGRLVEMLNHLVMQLDERLEADYEILSEWLPRIAYLAVIAVIVLGR